MYRTASLSYFWWYVWSIRKVAKKIKYVTLMASLCSKIHQISDFQQKPTINRTQNKSLDSQTLQSIIWYYQNWKGWLSLMNAYFGFTAHCVCSHRQEADAVCRGQSECRPWCFLPVPVNGKALHNMITVFEMLWYYVANVQYI